MLLKQKSFKLEAAITTSFQPKELNRDYSIIYFNIVGITFSHIQSFPIDYLYFKLKRKQEEKIKVKCPSDRIASHRLQSTENEMETISAGSEVHKNQLLCVYCLTCHMKDVTTHTFKIALQNGLVLYGLQLFAFSYVWRKCTNCGWICTHPALHLKDFFIEKANIKTIQQGKLSLDKLDFASQKWYSKTARFPFHHH